MGLKKEIEFDASNRTYRIVTSLNNTYDIHGFNALNKQVSIHTDLNTGEKVFVTWSNIAVLRFKDAPDGAPEG
jgi:aspartyl aminopeptidase